MGTIRRRPIDRSGSTPPISRRHVLQLGLAGTGAMALGPLGFHARRASADAPGTNRILVVLNCSGGNDTLNMVIPTLPEYAQVRGALAIPEAVSLSLQSGPHATTAYRFHPALLRLKSLWDEGAVSVVNRVGYPAPSLSHFTSQDILSYGFREAHPTGGPPSGWIARYAELFAPTPTGAVAVGFGRPKDLMGGTTTPLILSTLGQFQFNTDGFYPQSNIHRANAVKSMVAGIPTGGLPKAVAREVGNAYELASHVQDAIAAYSTRTDVPVYSSSALAQSLREIATLIHGGFDTRIFYTGLSGFDTHAAQGTTGGGVHPGLLSTLDEAVGTFAADLKLQNVWDRVAVVILTEFGRRNYPNGSDGTDHGHGFCALLVGGALALAGAGGVKGVDLAPIDLTSEYPLHAVDFRDVLRELVTDHLGASSASQVFPEAQPSGGVWDVI